MPHLHYHPRLHGSRPAYYLRKAKHTISRPFYPLLKWNDYNLSDSGENDPAWEARLRAMGGLASADFNSSCFHCVDRVLSEAACERERKDSGTVITYSMDMMAEREGTQVGCWRKL